MQNAVGVSLAFAHNLLNFLLTLLLLLMILCNIAVYKKYIFRLSGDLDAFIDRFRNVTITP